MSILGEKSVPPNAAPTIRSGATSLFGFPAATAGSDAPHGLETMTMLAPILLVAALSAAELQAFQGGTAPPPASEPARLALLVGIDDYSAAEGVPSLAGCVNDVRRAGELLVDRFEFARDDVLVLENEQATTEAIVRAFERHLLRRAGPGTEVVVWFSGHGSRVPDRSGVAGAELGDLDSSFLAWDSRAAGRSGEYDLTDDVFGALLEALSRRTERILWISDACHSGASLRGGVQPIGVRSVAVGRNPLDPGLLADFWPPEARLDEDRVEISLARARYAHVAACAPDQLAQEVRVEGPDGETLRHGALSWFLCLALEQAQPGASIRRVAEEAAVRLDSEIPGQTVWCEGAIERELFGSGFEPRTPGHVARLRNGRVQVEAGAAHGLRVGSRLELRDNARDERLGTAQVERLTALAGLARLEQGTRAADLEGKVLRAVEVARPEGVDELAVHAASDSLGTLLSGAEGVRLVPAEDADLLLETRAGRIVLVTRDGLTLLEAELDGAGSARRVRDTLREALAQERRYRSLFDLAAQQGQYHLEVHFVEALPEELERVRASLGRRAPAASAGDGSDARPAAEPQLAAAGFRVPAALAGQAAAEQWACEGGDSGNLRLGVLEVRNPHERDLHVAVVSIFEDRSRNLIWPTANQNDNIVPAGDRRRIPFLAVHPESWPLERAARDRYLVIATERHADFSGLQAPSQTRGEAALPGVLREALDAPLLRGGAQERDVSRQGWGVSYADLWVLPTGK